ncbi:hypothetical protein MTO96_013562 [Rhipicephalus appendiculatus]
MTTKRQLSPRTDNYDSLRTQYRRRRRRGAAQRRWPCRPWPPGGLTSSRGLHVPRALRAGDHHRSNCHLGAPQPALSLPSGPGPAACSYGLNPYPTRRQN